MANPENAPSAKIPYDPATYGLDPENNESDRTLVEESSGDQKLLELLMRIDLLKTEFDESAIATDEYYERLKALEAGIQDRHYQLGLVNDDNVRPSEHGLGPSEI